MQRIRLAHFVLLAVGLAFSFSLFLEAGAATTGRTETGTKSEPREFAGSVSCRQCHEKFYELWATSHHGLAMQPYTDALGQNELTPQTKTITVGRYTYQAFVGAGEGYVLEIGPETTQRYPIVHVLGGKNVYYFLANWKKGRLQTMPVAYDVQRGQWYDTAASGIRHFPGTLTDEAVHWTDPFYTFNTSCFDCHVSQLATNYDPNTDTYHTQWGEAGINCETCHGPSQRHVTLFEQLEEGQETPKDMKIIITRELSGEQINAMCSACHAKMSPLTKVFTPGQLFYDHFDLVTLENPDFYPDGRDLGENYTYTTWSMSPCSQSGKLDCSHCHTSSGRYRFRDPDNANNACLPCHAARVAEAPAHTHHTPGTEGSRCIDCHMPMTEFARMRRSDHSMRPPAPAATMEFKSPNACNICHDDKSALWADQLVRQWHPDDDYQQAILEPARLVSAARSGDWKRLDAMLSYLLKPDRDEVTATSLVRLLQSALSQKAVQVLVKVLQQDRSPLVRASAADALSDHVNGQTLPALLQATRDKTRLVRIRAAASLASVSRNTLKASDKESLDLANQELLKSWRIRQDDYSSHFNLANYWVDRNKLDSAVKAFEKARDLRPDYIPTHVNMAFAYHLQGQNDLAEKSFRNALKIDPNCMVAHLNLGMLLGEQGRISEAEAAFRKVLRSDPNSAVAAYNLGVILAKDRMAEALKWCRKAYQLRPNEPKYAYTYAFYLIENSNVKQAITILRKIVNAAAAYPDAYLLLGELFERQGRLTEAISVYRLGLKNKNLSERYRYIFTMGINRLQR